MASVPLLVIRNNGILKASSLRTPATVIAKSNYILSLAYRLTQKDVPQGKLLESKRNRLLHGLKTSKEATFTKNGKMLVPLCFW